MNRALKANLDLAINSITSAETLLADARTALSEESLKADYAAEHERRVSAPRRSRMSKWFGWMGAH